MTVNTRDRLRIVYLSTDYLSTLAALLIMTALRYTFESHAAASANTLVDFFKMRMVLVELALFPPLMLAIYWLSGYYTPPLMLKSRLQELLTTFNSTLLGAIVFFFTASIDDLSDDRLSTYLLFMLQWWILFLTVYLARFTATTIVRRKVRGGKLYSKVLIAGSGRAAASMYRKLQKSSRSMGFRLEGFIDCYGEGKCNVMQAPTFNTATAHTMLASGSIPKVVVVSSPHGIADTLAVINALLPIATDVLVDPDVYKSLGAPVRTQEIIGEPLVNITKPNIDGSTANIKRTIDVVASCAGLLLLSPLLALLALLVKTDSPGPAFYSQERQGRHKKPFRIYKFRSMRVDAEDDGPQLSSAHDERITRLGHTLRKYRLDELPQLWNILKGDMSLVGPRPEREHYVRLIMERVPAYTLVQQVRPGLTSWGMVKFGYASNVDQMIERLRYELYYLDNQSTLLDLRIILFTVRTVVTGRGV